MTPNQAIEKNDDPKSSDWKYTPNQALEKKLPQIKRLKKRWPQIKRLEKISQINCLNDAAAAGAAPNEQELHLIVIEHFK